MSVKDLSVCVLFDEKYQFNDESDARASTKVMVVYSPTLMFLCETCFMLPTVFHEIAHQFRYEERKKRNACLTRYVIKQIIVGILLDMINQEDRYRVTDEHEFRELINEICGLIETNLCLETYREDSLPLFKEKLIHILNEFAEGIQPSSGSLLEIIAKYIGEAKRDVVKFDTGILKILERMNSAADKDGDAKNEVLILLDEFNEAQYRQLLEGVADNWEGKYSNCEDAVSDIAEEIKTGPYAKNEWLEGRQEWARKVFHVKMLYQQYYILISQGKFRQSAYCRAALDQIVKIVYPKLCGTLQRYRQTLEQIDDTVIMPEGTFEQSRKKIELEGEVGLRKQIIKYFADVKDYKLTELIDTSVDLYREVTSDLFMCSIMDLDVWGYLMVVSETFVFRKGTEDALYRRISMVLQCLMKCDDKIELNEDTYNDCLLSALRKETGVLIEKANIECGLPGAYIDTSCEDIIACIGKLVEDMNFNTTQKWIIRMYYQAAHIVYNLMSVQIIADEVAEQDIWLDISGEDAYLAKKAQLKELLRNNNLEGLCEGISSILNSPAIYFQEQKSLLELEVKFILENYEKNRRNIFRMED